MPKERDPINGGTDAFQKMMVRAQLETIPGRIGVATVRKGVQEAFWAIAIVLTLAGTIIATISNAVRGYDDTDAPGHRSNLEVRMDCATGLQYLTTKEGGLTSRLGIDGQHLRGACE